MALGAAGVVLAVVYLFATHPVTTGQEMAMLNFTCVPQGILCAGCSLFAVYLITRSKKDDPS